MVKCPALLRSLDLTVLHYASSRRQQGKTRNELLHATYVSLNTISRFSTLIKVNFRLH
jgi:hypothetical protein